MITIRPEETRDHEAISQVRRCAFGQEGEAKLVTELRKSKDFSPELSLQGLTRWGFWDGGVSAGIQRSLANGCQEPFFLIKEAYATKR